MEEKIEKSLCLCICFFQSSLCDPHEHNFADPELFRFRLVQSHPGHAHLIVVQRAQGPSDPHLQASCKILVLGGTDPWRRSWLRSVFQVKQNHMKSHFNLNVLLLLDNGQLPPLDFTCSSILGKQQGAEALMHTTCDKKCFFPFVWMFNIPLECTPKLAHFSTFKSLNRSNTS